MSGLLLKALDFLKDNFSIIKTNWYLFAVCVILSVGITTAIYEKVRKKDKEKIANFTNQTHELEQELSRLKESLYEIETGSWITASATNTTPKNTVAEDISQKFQSANKQ